MKVSRVGWCDFSGKDLGIVTGCTPVSEGCRFCYGKAIYDRFGRDFSKVTIHPDKLDRLRRKQFPEYSPKRGKPHRPMCFIVDTGDLFHKNVPADFITLAFEVMEWRKDVIWQVLTKRPKRMNSVLFGAEGNYFLGGGDYIPNIHLGVSVENNETTWRIAELAQSWEGVKFVSFEPLLELIDIREFLWERREVEHIEYVTHEMATDAGDLMLVGEPVHLISTGIWEPSNTIQQIIVGAEAGPYRRPFNPAWAKSIRDQCAEAGIAFFGKQTSGFHPGKPLLIDGIEIKEWPDGK